MQISIGSVDTSRLQVLEGIPYYSQDAVSIPTLSCIISSIDHSQTHDDYLFCAMICTGLYGLLHLGKLSYPDNSHLCNPEKLSHRSSVTFPTTGTYAFMLPCHKTDPFFEGSCIHICCLIHNAPDPLPHFISYLSSCDHLFPFNRELWLRQNGSDPTRSFFIPQVSSAFGRNPPSISQWAYFQKPMSELNSRCRECAMYTCR